MSRLDVLLVRRIGGRILLVAVIFLGLIILVETIDSWRYQYLASVGGWPLALFGMLVGAAVWLFRALALVILLGTVVGVVDLQSRRELLAIKATGLSAWRILRAPLLLVLIIGLGVTLVGEDVVTTANRSLSASVPGDEPGLAPGTGLWLEQYANGERYVLEAEHVVGASNDLQGVSMFFPDGLNQGRITAPLARLGAGVWLLPTATRYRAGLGPETLTDFSVPTTTTPSELRLKLSSTDDMTFFELFASLNSKLGDPDLRNAVTTRFLRLAALPVLLVGALFIAFAFTAGYRRSVGYGAPIVYAIFLGFVVFVIGEMADRAGSSGALDPTLAACGPAFVAIVIGLTMLLYTEDGRV